ncbi:MAG: type IV pilus twitching motility protein PilT [Abitibacteriaceae bacterium]|nr:type IV pilus twitching motility protein PilT [Abditibacteriaceae bacterium]MBV9867853.1 type IV pilus twitching motility protein PilT [Abditibacteriaceae bacterium]
MAIDIDALLRFGTEADASDVFLKEGAPPTLRLNGTVRKLDHPTLTNDDIEGVAKMMMSGEKWLAFQTHPDHDLSYSIPGVARFRVNVYKQRGAIAMVLRVVKLKIRQFAELGLPEVLADFTRSLDGLVLVTGPTGSGKSTTLAAMLDLINQERRGHIVTIEDPIEYIHPDKGCLVSQREVGIDTAKFGDALRASLREAPDVILVGELRDVETMGICLQAAETGHLVFSTLHTASAAESMERILSMFQPHEKALVQQRLSKTMRAIISQKLVPTVDGKSRVCAVEILNVSPTVAQYIEEGRSGQIYQAIKEGASQWKMQTMNMALDKHAKEGNITEEQALEYSSIRSELRQMLRRTAEEGKG